MLRIHRAIQAGGYPNAGQLANELEVSTKSVYRDLEFMRDRLELPLNYDSARRGFHYEGDVSSFPSLQITEGELFALVVAEKAVQQYRGTPFEKPLVSALRKMAQTLPETISLRWEDWDRTISFRTSAEPIVDLMVFETLAKATAQRLQLRLDYRKPGQALAESRIVDPYHLANINGEWFLFGHCHLRGDLRTFVPARIKAAAPTGKTFARPGRFSLERRLRGSFGVISGSMQHSVVIQFSGLVSDYIREKRWHASQKLRDLVDGGVELTLTLSSLTEVQRWILGWGGEATVIQPLELAEAIADSARQILARYEAREGPPSKGETALEGSRP